MNNEYYLCFQCDSVGCATQQGRSNNSMQTVVTLSKLVTPQAMQQCLQFLYTGTIDSRFCELQVSWYQPHFNFKYALMSAKLGHKSGRWQMISYTPIVFLKNSLFGVYLILYFRNLLLFINKFLCYLKMLFQLYGLSSFLWGGQIG